jgi:hypothetical protein
LVFQCPPSPVDPPSKMQVFPAHEEPLWQQSAKPWQKPPAGEQQALAALHWPEQHWVAVLQELASARQPASDGGPLSGAPLSAGLGGVQMPPTQSEVLLQHGLCESHGK